MASAPHDPGAEQLAGALLGSWPRARLTWATDLAENEFELDRWLGAGVEVLNRKDLSWIGERLFHYDLVVLAEDLPAGLIAELAHAQPQAPVVSLRELWRPGQEALPTLVAVAARAGIAPPV